MALFVYPSYLPNLHQFGRSGMEKSTALDCWCLAQFHDLFLFRLISLFKSIWFKTFDLKIQTEHSLG